MSIHEQEEQLFQEWKKQEDCTPFVKDGVVNETAYKASNRKVAFILKEYGSWGEDDHDLREWELINPCGPGWPKVAKILHGINILHNPAVSGSGVPQKMPDNICAFNMMKKRGDSKTDWNELSEIAQRDRDFIRRQFEIYDPDLAFCMGYDERFGNMLDIFRKVMGHENISKRHTEKEGWGWYERMPGKIVVNTYHMSGYGRGEQSADAVLDMVKEIDDCR